MRIVIEISKKLQKVKMILCKMKMKHKSHSNMSIFAILDMATDNNHINIM